MSIVQKKLVVLIARKRFPQLLQSPLRRRMFRDIEVKQTSGADLKGNESIKDTEAHRYGNEEVASDNSICMVPDEGGPALIVVAMWAWRLPNVFSNRAWREPNLQFEPKLICNPLFAPGRIFGCHATN